LVSLLRNGWSASSEMGGQLGAKRVVNFGRDTHLTLWRRQWPIRRERFAFPKHRSIARSTRLPLSKPRSVSKSPSFAARHQAVRTAPFAAPSRRSPAGRCGGGG